MRQASLTPENRLRFLQRFDFSTEVFIRLNVLVRESFELYISFSSMYSRWRRGAESKTDRAKVLRCVLKCYGAC